MRLQIQIRQADFRTREDLRHRFQQQVVKTAEVAYAA